MTVPMHIMPHHENPFAALIEELWERRTDLSAATVTPEQLEAIEHVIEELDQGKLRVAEKIDGEWEIGRASCRERV